MREDKILLFGDTGQVGHELSVLLGEREDLGKLHVSKIDFTDREALAAMIEKIAPKVIINAAAYTDVEKAESESTQAYDLNAYAPQVIAKVAKKIGAVFIHYSTDYVFSSKEGVNGTYCSYDTTGEPLNVYGRSKLLGEKLILEAECSSIILRTSWVFSNRRKNFLLTLLKKASVPLEHKVVDDQIGSPTSAKEIARQTVAVLNSTEGNYEQLKKKAGLYHLACKEYCTWYKFACEIMKQSSERGVVWQNHVITPVPSSEYKTAAVRPKNSRLECSEFEDTFYTELITWKQALTEVLEQHLRIAH